MRFTVDERRWLTMLLLGMVWAAGVGCSRWRKDDAGTWKFCCEGVDSCLGLLQRVDGPDPGPEHGLPEEQQCAAWKLGMEEPALVPRLIPLLSHADSRVRKGATYTLGLMNGKAESAVPALLASFEQEPRDDILSALRKIDDPRAAPLLRKHLARISSVEMGYMPPNLSSVLLEVLEEERSPQRLMTQVSFGLASYPGQFEDSARPRLRALLKRELAEPVLRRPPDAVCPSPPVSSCQVVFDECTPRATYVLWALAGVGHVLEAEEVVAVREALRRGDARFSSVALLSLLRARSPEAVAPLLAQQALPDCRLEALNELVRLDSTASPQAFASLVQLLESSSEGWERAEAVRVLSVLEQEEVFEPLRRALGINHSEVQAAAASELGRPRFREHAPELLPLLEKLATDASSPVTRKNARSSVYALQRQQQSQEGVPADRLALDGPKRSVSIRAGTGPVPRCPEVTPRGKDWKLKDQTEALLLRPVRDESSLQLGGPCAGLRDAEYASIAAPLGEACLMGRDDGEFGGWLRVYEKASTTMLTGANPRRFLEVHGQAVVLSGLSHLGSSEGQIFRVERTAGGEWRAVPWVTLPGEPVAYGYDRRGDLVLATYAEHPRIDAEEHCFGRGLGYFDLVRVTRDGQLTQ